MPDTTPPVPPEIVEWTQEERRVARFWTKVDRRADHECWLWLGPLTTHGYGRFNTSRDVRIQAHRAAYQLLVGAVPDGLQLDHTCHTLTCPGGDSCPHRACVNPNHLQPVTCAENVLRGTGPTARLARKTHCDEGHALDAVKGRNRERYCRTCRIEYQRAWRASRAEQGSRAS